MKCRVVFCADAALFGWRLCSVHHALWSTSYECDRAMRSLAVGRIDIATAALADWVWRHTSEMVNGHGPTAKPTPTHEKIHTATNGDLSKKFSVGANMH